MPAGERGRGTREILSHVLDLTGQGRPRDRGTRPLECGVEVGTRLRETLVDPIEGRLYRRLRPDRFQPPKQRVRAGGHLLGSDPLYRSAASAGLCMHRLRAHVQREKDQDQLRYRHTFVSLSAGGVLRGVPGGFIGVIRPYRPHRG